MKSGINRCPVCGGESDLLSTTNEWRYFCPNDDIRFNEDGKIFVKDE